MKTLTPCQKCKKGYSSKVMAIMHGGWTCPECVGGMLDKIQNDAVEWGKVVARSDLLNSYELMFDLIRLWLDHYVPDDILLVGREQDDPVREFIEELRISIKKLNK